MDRVCEKLRDKVRRTKLFDGELEKQRRKLKGRIQFFSERARTLERQLAEQSVLHKEVGNRLSSSLATFRRNLSRKPLLFTSTTSLLIWNVELLQCEEFSHLWCFRMASFFCHSLPLPAFHRVPLWLFIVQELWAQSEACTTSREQEEEERRQQMEITILSYEAIVATLKENNKNQLVEVKVICIFCNLWLLFVSCHWKS